MALTELLDKLKRKEPDIPELFLAIQIDAEFVKTAIWSVHDHLTEIVALGSTSEWDGSSTQVMVEAIDSSLSIALEKIGDQPESDRVIFGLPETWTTLEGVAPPRLVDLKTVCEKLNLKPLGFVVTTEAITHYLKTIEGTPLSAILLRVSTSEVAVTVVHLGNIRGTHVAGRSGDLAADVREGLARFGDRDSLPSRILLYNGSEDLEELSQQLLAYDWQETMPFLHIPKIESLDETFSITAVAKAGGGEVAKSLGFVVADVEKPSPKASRNDVQDQEEKDSEVEAMPGERETTTTEGMTAPHYETAEPIQEKTIHTARSSLLRSSVRAAQRIVSRIPSIFQVIRKLSRPQISFPVNRLLATAGFVAILTGGVLTGVISIAKRVPRVAITIELKGQTVNQRMRVIIGTSITEPRSESGELPAQEMSIEKSLDMSKETTGKDVTGEKAKGTVTIFNRRTDGSKTFPAGTKLLDLKSKLKFLTDDEVAIASASAGQDYAVIPGKQTVSATAASFGSEYNLDANTELQITDFSTSTYIAKNDTAFSGGEKRDVRVASKKDHATLREELIEKLKEATKEEIELPGEKRTFSETMTVKSTKESYSAEFGEEASSVSLSMEAEVSAITIEELQLAGLVEAMLAPYIPEGYALSPGGVTISTESIEEIDEGKVVLNVVASANVTPRVDEQWIRTEIAGKRPGQAAEIIKKLPYFQRMEMSFRPVLPSIIQWVPVTKDHTEISIVTSQ